MMRYLALLLVAVLAPVSALAGPTDPKAARLSEVQHAKVVVVQGSADHMDQVLKKAGTDFVVVTAEELAELPLHSQQVLMVNCRGVMSESARNRVRRFVAAGGFLYTTDHAVHELIEKVFPGTIQWNRKTTTQRVFPMQTSGDQGLLAQIDNGAQWQVAGGGYLFDIIGEKKVEVLMRSDEAARAFGGNGVLGVKFRHQDGQVIHVTGHFYTQPGITGPDAVAQAPGSFEQLTGNIVKAKAEDQGRIDGLYDKSSARPVTLQAAPKANAKPVARSSVTRQKLKKGTQLKVLESKGEFSKVRDTEGNEGWVDSAAVE